MAAAERRAIQIIVGAKARGCMRPGFAQAWTGEGARPHMNSFSRCAWK
jgi:hypothetical protein